MVLLESWGTIIRKFLGKVIMCVHIYRIVNDIELAKLLKVRLKARMSMRARVRMRARMKTTAIVKMRGRVKMRAILIIKARLTSIFSPYGG